MITNKQKYINKLFKAAKEHSQKDIEKLICRVGDFEEESETTLFYEEWEIASENYKKSIKRKKIIKNSLLTITSLLLVFISIFITLFLIRKPTINEVYSGNFQWMFAPTETSVPTTAPTPTSTQIITTETPFFIEDEGMVLDIGEIHPVLPLLNPEKVWISKSNNFVNNLNSTTEMNTEEYNYVSEGGSGTLYLNRSLNPGIYQICYLNPIEHAKGEYDFLVEVDGEENIPMNNGDSKLILMDNLNQEEGLWVCMGYFSIPSTENFTIEANINIDQVDYEFPLTEILFMRLENNEEKLIQELSSIIDSDSKIIAIEDDNDIFSNSEFSSIEFVDYWGTGFAEFQNLEINKSFPVVFKRIIYLDPGNYQLAVHTPIDNCETNISYWLAEFDGNTDYSNLEKFPGDELLITSENCAENWIIGGKWTLEETIPILIQAEINTQKEGVSASFDAVAIIKNIN